MNPIAQRQNEENSIQLLAAQRQLYRDYKQQFNLWLAVAVTFAILGSLTVAVLQVPIAIGSVLLVALELIIMPQLNRKRRQAAEIQELLDTQLFELPWNWAMNTKPSSETVIKYANKHFRTDSDIKRQALTDWYSASDMSQYPLAQARIIAQRQNIWWDSEQRRKYVNWITVAVLILIAVLAVIGFLPSWRVQQFNAAPLLLFLPLIVLLLKNLAEHREAADRLEQLHIVAKSLWDDACRRQQPLSESDVTELTFRSRNLQTEIFHHRNQTPPILDWIYNKFKMEQENDSSTPGFFTQESKSD